MNSVPPNVSISRLRSEAIGYSVSPRLRAYIYHFELKVLFVTYSNW